MDKLGLYNEALRLCGERVLASLTEDREPRRLLDSTWDANSYDTWLEETDWYFAMRSVKIGYDPSISPEWGAAYAFVKPLDMARVSGLYQDEYMNVPSRDYLDEGKYWFVDGYTEIYVRYVSNGASYGGDIGLWPASFAKYVAAFLAYEISPRLKNNVDSDALRSAMMIKEREAKSKNSLKLPSQRLPTGSWVNARLAGSRRDTGNRY